MTSKAWYWAAAGLFLVGTSVLIMATMAMGSAAPEMNRVVMPGKAELVLPAGRSTLYLERESIVDGKPYRAREDLSYRCSLTDTVGQTVPLEPPTTPARYSGAGYTGESALEVRIALAGTYALACESSTGPFVMAVGIGAGAWRWVAVIGGGVPNLIAAILFAVVLLKRWRQKQARAAR
ncbi:MAG TPA: hypothetical protein VNO30_00680 [Kofleriaceae bacterium]|nr:hypothetical protein [Kofleriaceae bacterium]